MFNISYNIEKAITSHDVMKQKEIPERNQNISVSFADGGPINIRHLPPKGRTLGQP